MCGGRSCAIAARTQTASESAPARKSRIVRRAVALVYASRASYLLRPAAMRDNEDMRGFVALQLGCAALRRNRMRTLLTMLGMIIGVAAVISIAARGAGGPEPIEARIASAGTNLLVVLASNRTIGGVRLGWARRAA